jgi:hypothetical protein
MKEVEGKINEVLRSKEKHIFTIIIVIIIIIINYNSVVTLWQ